MTAETSTSVILFSPTQKVGKPLKKAANIEKEGAIQCGDGVRQNLVGAWIQEVAVLFAS